MNTRETRLHAFGRACHIVVDNLNGDAEELLTLATDELQRVESKFCSRSKGSLTNEINLAAGTGAFTPLDEEAVSLLRFVDALWHQSKHVFDPTTRIIQECYDEKGRIRATPEQLQGMLKLVDWSQLEVTDDGAHLKQKGMLVDLNACVCPYAVDSVRKVLTQQGAQHALIELDRDVATIGKQPDGANWLVGSRFPRGSRTAIARLKLNGKGYAIRGDYERAVTLGGERYGRALSPVDGQPIPGLLSVAVIADNCLTACSAASVARLKTEPAALKWLDSVGLPWLAVDRSLQCHGPLAPGQ